MAPVVVSEKALRDLVGEALDGGHLGDLTVPEEEETPVNVNPVVDPSAAETDPINPDFVPQNKAELGVAINQLTKDVPVDNVPKFYKTLRAVLAVEKHDDEEDEQMKKAAKAGPAQVEETIRLSVRRALKEMVPDPADVDADEEEAEAGGRRRPAAYKSTAIGNMFDVGGASFEEIATSLNFSVAGAKRAVDKALEKARFLGKMDLDDKEILVLTSMNDYIKMLSKSGELSPADIQLMKDHPDIVRELDGFREFLNNSIRRARKGGQQLEDPMSEAPKSKLKLKHSPMITCPDCNGTGEMQVRKTHGSMTGPSSISSTKECELCVGHGKISKRDLYGEAKHQRLVKEAIASVTQAPGERRNPASLVGEYPRIVANSQRGPQDVGDPCSVCGSENTTSGPGDDLHCDDCGTDFEFDVTTADYRPKLTSEGKKKSRLTEASAEETAEEALSFAYQQDREEFEQLVAGMDMGTREVLKKKLSYIMATPEAYKPPAWAIVESRQRRSLSTKKKGRQEFGS